MRRAILTLSLTALLLCCVSGTEPEVSCRVVVVIEISDTTTVVDTTVTFPPASCVPESVITTTITR